jgi:hypothetical protein
VRTTRAMVVTTINSPTPAMLDLSLLGSDWHFLVIGDNKTPEDWKAANSEFVSIAAQRQLKFSLASLLPENHYCRKNLGYLLAIQDGPELVAETDDDNLPTGWKPGDVLYRSTLPYVDQPGWANVYKYYTDSLLWPRGFPLELIDTSHDKMTDFPQPRAVATPVHQFLASGDPDVDATYRMTVGRDDHEYRDGSVVFGRDVIVPFNSQCTVWLPPAYMFMYLPSYVSFRMTDIWRSFVAQVCMWSNDDFVAYHSPGVRQVRNEHDLLRDFSDEIPGYLNNRRILDELSKLDLDGNNGDKLLACYSALNDMGIVPDSEMPLVKAWVSDLRELGVE